MNKVVSIFGLQENLTLELRPCDFLKILLAVWVFESHCFKTIFTLQSNFPASFSISKQTTTTAYEGNVLSFC